MTTQAVFIDWDGTSSTSRFWEHWQENDGSRYQKIQQNLFINNQDLVQGWMLGQYSAEKICAILSPLVGIEVSELMENLEESCRKMKFVSPEVPELVGQIRKRGMKVVVATDNMDTFDRWTLPALGLDRLYDGILNSFYLKVFKKNGDKFFGDFLRKNNIDPHNCLMIDDSEGSRIPLTEYGFDYRKIEKGTGLVSELRKMLGK